MNGGHDLGGMHGLGPIAPEPENDEPVFHASWEQRGFALTLAAGFLGKWNIDQSRHARERQHPADYIRNSYYENWLVGLETLLDDSQLLAHTSKGSLPVLQPEKVAATLAKGGPVTMEIEARAKFKIGDQVKVRNNHPSGHTRAPRYTRGKQGCIADHHGVHVFPDRNAEGAREGQHLYSVRFEAHTLWGETRRSAVYVDLWDDYLEPP